MKLKINITQDILERSKMCGLIKGQKSISTNCAIALAIRDIFPQSSVGHDIHVYEITGDILTIDLPEEAVNFIANFDRFTSKERVKMQPFSFEIDIPQEIIDTINIDEVKEVLKDHKTLELIES